MGSPDLPTLLSQAFLAWTIEVDNVFEATMPHVTSARRRSAEPGAPWLTSCAMYWTCLRHLDDGMTLAELHARTGLETNLNGMRRWGYVSVDGAPDDRAAVRLRPELVLRATDAGRRAKRTWAAALDEVDRRWRDRFGEPASRLARSLATIDASLPSATPDSLPIIGPGLSNAGRARDVIERTGSASEPPLAIHLGRVLVALALDLDTASPVPMAVASNLLRLVDEEPTDRRLLPVRAGVSRPAIAMALDVASKRGLVEAAGTDGQSKPVRLTAPGATALARFEAAVEAVEDRWTVRLGAARMDALRSALAALVEPLDSGLALIRIGLAAPPDGWRAAEPATRVLPHAPMVLHRGGYPDGA